MADKENQEPTKEYLVHQNEIIDKGFQEINDVLEKKVSENRKLLNTPRLKSIETMVPEVPERTDYDSLIKTFALSKDNIKFGPRTQEVVIPCDSQEQSVCVDHYSNGGYVCRDVMKAVFTEPMDPTEAFYLCNAFKYLWRCQHKGQYINDIKKVYDYMGYILQLYENGLGTFQNNDDDEE